MSNERFTYSHPCLGRVQRGWFTDTDVLHLSMMGSHLIILNNSTVATDLLERSVAYTDRV